MAWRKDEPELLSTAEAFDKLTVGHLKPLAALLTDAVPTRKPELVALLSKAMSRAKEVQGLYEKLDPLAQFSVQEAAHDPRGQLHRDRFLARHGQMPDFHQPVPEKRSGIYGYEREGKPTILRLFFPQFDILPTDLRELLLAFVPSPPEFVLLTCDELPATITQTWHTWKMDRSVAETVEVPLRVREMAREAPHDLKALLRLIEMGRVRVSDKKKQPTAASQKAIAPVLQGGDFYTAEDQEKTEYEPDTDLTIKAFAWPMLLQASGLAHKVGDGLSLTPAGRKALAQPAHPVLRDIWKKWRSSTLLDEFNRVEAIKGQGKGGLSALAARRKTAVDALAHCPVGRWFKVDDFFRFLRATGRDCALSHRPFELYIAEHHYGNLGHDSEHSWEQLQGRYILAVLFEYAATVGLIDLAYLPPQGARDDFRDRWGTDELDCLSRYDGLLYLRINPLGAWCLGRTAKYEPPAREADDALQVLPNRDVVVRKPPLPASDRLLLDRFGEPESELVWKLSAERILAVLAEGGSLEELRELLSARGAAPLPQPVQVFLDDLQHRASTLRDLGVARLVECADAELAQMLAGDPQLRGKCHRAGERWLVFRVEEEAAVRRVLKRLGHILPPPSD